VHELPYDLLSPVLPLAQMLSVSALLRALVSSQHDALPILGAVVALGIVNTELEAVGIALDAVIGQHPADDHGIQSDAYSFQLGRSEEHTSELQSRENLVCRLLLGKKKTGRSESGCAIHVPS